MARDNYLPLILPATQTSSTNGTALDLLKGTNIEKDSIAGTNLLGSMGLGNMLQAIIEVSGVTGTSPTCTFVLQHSDDNSTWVTIQTSGSVTGNGTTALTFNPTKRYVRLNTTIGGTTPSFTIDAYVGTLPA